MPGQGPHHPSRTGLPVICSHYKCHISSALLGHWFMLEGLISETRHYRRANPPAPLQCPVPAPAHPTFAPAGLNDGSPEPRSYRPRGGCQGGCQVGPGAAKDRSALWPHTGLCRACCHGGESPPWLCAQIRWSESGVAPVGATQLRWCLSISLLKKK